ncbi:protein aardvark [Anaeramoeba ignava]|uniref:Protein aardvark n=1 Tax=Anaeramoeba ignava TaxID=1746090 RepID=A0A9Q0LQ38_ANAIG|nr:protein aardvark [Anaeramoeba ignava]
MSTINNYPNNQNIQEKCISILINLAIHPGNIVAYNEGELKGIEPVIKSMNNFLNSEDIQKYMDVEPYGIFLLIKSK